MKTAIYVRVSTDEQSIEMQKRDIAAYLEFKGIRDYLVYEDTITGTSVDRPALNALLSDVSQGLINLIVVYKLDRLGRSLSHLMETLATFEKHNVKFMSIKDNFDLSTPTGVLLMHILGAFAQFERDIIIERTKSGMNNAKAKGIRIGRPGLDPNVKASILADLNKFSARQVAEKYNVSRMTITRIKNSSKVLN
jgi:DNA invertase Pin-like site-specific DNA recombinase